NDLAELGDSRRRSIFGFPETDGGDPGFADMGWCGKVGLADFEMDDLSSLGFEGLGLGEDGIGAFGSERNDAISEGAHG
ncbi:MAG: hypothetical protein IMZ73_07500, partial [Chloroflexi bacterium]|nr:hypothetical protein [Chloroflexota bacterium]